MRPKALRSVSTLVVCVGLLHAPAHAARYVRQRTLTSPLPNAIFNDFGYALTTVGSTLVVGDSANDSGNHYQHGAVSLFDGTTFDLLRSIFPPALCGTCYFGTAIAPYGSNLVVGSPGGEPNGFTAYIVDVNTGALLASLRDPNPHNPVAPYRGFGGAVATSGSRVLIGAPGDNPVGYPGQGSATLMNPFGSPGGALVFNLANPVPQASSYFGQTLAVLGTRLIVAAPFGNFTGGRVYEFDGSTGALLQTIAPPLGENSLGRAMAVDATTLFASGLQVYRFAADGTLLRTYTNPSAEPYDNFGNAIAVGGSVLLVGAEDANGGSNVYAGAAQLFDIDSGTLLQTLPNPEPNQSVHFGHSVAVVGKYLAIGSPSASGSRVLIYAPCGDGVPDPIEECDDGNLIDGDGCDSNCRFTGCGNGAVSAGEQCDDGNTVAGDGCRPDCTIEACGDSILDPQEQCDDGNQVDEDGCDVNCRPTGCGNAHVTSGEECDDGNTAAGDCCSTSCTFDSAGTQCYPYGSPFGSCDGAGHCMSYAIPTLSEWGLLVLASVMLLFVLRRRRPAAGRRLR